MALSDPVSQSIALDACYGDGKAAAAPASIEVAFFHGDPDNGGTELDTAVGGYGRVVLTNTTANFPDSVDGRKDVPVSLVATGALSDTITHWQFYDHADGTTRWDNGQFANEMSIDAAGTASGICSVYFGTLA